MSDWDWDDAARRIIWMLIALVAVVFVTGFSLGSAFSQTCEEGAFGCGHEENHDLYKNWTHDTNGGKCCNGQDCRPVRATKDEDGDWRIYIPEFKNVTDGKRIIKGWLFVPPSQVNKPDKFHDGRSHACTSPVYPPDSAAAKGFKYYLLPDIYCFTPAQPKI